MATYAYQWQRDNTGGGTYSDISSATTSTYTLVTADRYCHVRCKITATNSGGSTSAFSNAVGPVHAVFTGATASTYTDTISTAGVPTKFAATATSETVSVGTAGRLTAKAATATAETVAIATAGTPTKFAATTTSETVGIATAGVPKKFSATATTITDTIGSVGRVTAKAATATTVTVTVTTAGELTFQWQRDNVGSAPYTNIAGATAPTYLLQHADISCHVRCVVTAHNPFGATSANSNVVGPVAVTGSTTYTSGTASTYTATFTTAGSRTVRGATSSTYTVAISETVHCTYKSAVGGSAVGWGGPWGSMPWGGVSAPPKTLFLFSASASGVLGAGGAASMAITDTISTDGTRTALSASASTYTVTFTDTGLLTAMGATATTITDTISTGSLRATFGATTSTYMVDAVTTGIRQTFSGTITDETISIETVGTQPPAGVVRFNLNCTFDTAGLPLKFGAADLAETVETDTVGRVEMFSATASIYLFTTTTATRRGTFGVVTMPIHWITTTGFYPAGTRGSLDEPEAGTLDRNMEGALT
jgi:hypothetical protein